MPDGVPGSYNLVMKKKTGRPSGWDEKLGNGVMKGRRFPMPIHKMLSEKQVKQVLNKMALDPDFKVQVISLLNNNTDQKH